VYYEYWGNLLEFSGIFPLFSPSHLMERKLNLSLVAHLPNEKTNKTAQRDDKRIVGWSMQSSQ
jgi:hypothetical protein